MAPRRRLQPPSYYKHRARWVLAGAAAVGLALGTMALGKNIQSILSTRKISPREKTSHSTREVERKQREAPVPREELRPSSRPKNRIVTLTPEQMHAETARWTRFAREHRTKFDGKYHPNAKAKQLCDEIAPQYSIERAWFKAIIEQESQFDPRAIAKDNGIGLGQLMPLTLTELHRLGVPIENPLDLKENLEGSAFLLETYRTRAETKLFFQNGKATPFTKLPIKAQIGIVSRMYNAGPSILARENYDSDAITSNTYVQRVLERRERFLKE